MQDGLPIKYPLCIESICFKPSCCHYFFNTANMHCRQGTAHPMCNGIPCKNCFTAVCSSLYMYSPGSFTVCGRFFLFAACLHIKIIVFIVFQFVHQQVAFFCYAITFISRWFVFRIVYPVISGFFIFHPCNFNCFCGIPDESDTGHFFKRYSAGCWFYCWCCCWSLCWL